jgi:hypothetical protein
MELQAPMVRFIPDLEPIIAAIRQTLSSHGLEALLATETWDYENVLVNVKTYMWGCGFGIAVFDKHATEQFKPNVALELGYMMALQSLP